MKDAWTYPELIDLEYCLSLDNDQNQSDLHERDRRICLDGPEDLQGGGRDGLVRHWLRTRKQQLFGAAGDKSPGTMVSESYRSLSALLSILGILLGLAAALSFLAYSGSTPVNVLNFLFLFIFSQLLIMAVVIPVLGLRMAGVSAIPAPIVSLYALVSGWFSNRAARLADHIPADRRAAYARIAGLWKKHRSRYRQAAYWPLFTLSQYTMTGFNFGLLTATLYRLITSDIAFGWQSTIQFSASAIHKTVSALALPWSWAVPDGHAYPSIAEIEGSRIILKDGIYHLATENLVSWWPFLVLCIVVYGLVFRFLLIMIGRAGRKRALRGLPPDTPALIQLVRRMQSPLVTSQAPASSSQPEKQAHPVLRGGIAGGGRAAASTVLLLPAEMGGDEAYEAVSGRLERCGFGITGHRIFMAGHEADQALIDELAALDWPAGSGIAAVVEAWMPPISETLTLIRTLRAAVGPTVPMWVVLAGQPDRDGLPASVSDADRVAWRRKIDELADPFLDLAEL